MIPAARVPPELAESVRDRWPDVDEGWPRAVERELDEVCARFGAVPSKVLPARYSFVVVANTRHGDLVVRVTPDPDAMNRGRAAQLLGECGAGPTVHEVRATALGVWTISDQVVPGISLHGAPLGSMNLELMVAPFRALAQVRIAADSFPTLCEWLRHRLAQPDLRDVPPGQSVASLDEREYAQDILQDLEADVDPTKLCHGDADLGNLLLSAPTAGLRGRLRLVGQRVNLIEPRGVRGEVEYDIGVLALKHASSYWTEAARVLCIQLAVYAEVDIERAVKWLEVAYAARV